MLKQEKRTKPSSSQKKLLRELGAAKGGFDALEICLRSKRSDVMAITERRLVYLRRELLIELVNAKCETSLKRVERQAAKSFRPEPPGIIGKFSDALRRIWLPSTGLRVKQRIVHAWFVSGFRDIEVPGLRILLDVERMVLDHQNLRLQESVVPESVLSGR
jgi:hypothetical protein